MKDNIHTGCRVKYRGHEGVVFDFEWRKSTTPVGKIMVGVKFDQRWHWDMDHKQELYLNYNDVKKIKIRVFTLEDPYGEEDWND